MIRKLVLEDESLSYEEKIEKLSKRAFEINIKDKDLVDSVIEDLTDTIESLPEDVLYLTANQIGIDCRAFAMRFRDGGTRVLLNPAIQKKANVILFREKDYINGDEYFVPRFANISIVYQERDNDKLEYGVIRGLKLNEGASVIVGQALDALNGLFDHDYGLIILPEFDEASEEEKSEVLEMYANSIKSTYESLDSELSNDDDCKSTWGASKFVTALARGDIEEAPEELSNRKKKKLKKFLKSLKLVK